MNEPRKLKIETPLGSVESDSGNHLIDIGTIIVIIVVFFLVKKIFRNS